MSKYFGASAVPRLKPTEGSLCTFAQPPSTIQSPVTDCVMPGILCARSPQFYFLTPKGLHCWSYSGKMVYTTMESGA